jgi:PAS domain S-box-containing protein
MLMKAERALIAPGEESFAALVASVADCAIFVLDAQGCVASWNAGAERMTGYRADEIIGRRYTAFFTAEDSAAGAPARALRNAAEARRFEDIAWRVRKDGSRFLASVVLTALLNPDGSLRGYLKVARRDAATRRRMAPCRTGRDQPACAVRAGPLAPVRAHRLDRRARPGRRVCEVP